MHCSDKGTGRAQWGHVHIVRSSIPFINVIKPVFKPGKLLFFVWSSNFTIFVIFLKGAAGPPPGATPCLPRRKSGVRSRRALSFRSSEGISVNTHTEIDKTD